MVRAWMEGLGLVAVMAVVVSSVPTLNNMY
jgi:hypothetical protein